MYAIETDIQIRQKNQTQTHAHNRRWQLNIILLAYTHTHTYIAHTRFRLAVSRIRNVLVISFLADRKIVTRFSYILKNDQHKQHYIWHINACKTIYTFVCMCVCVCREIQTEKISNIKLSYWQGALYSLKLIINYYLKHFKIPALGMQPNNSKLSELRTSY